MCESKLKGMSFKNRFCSLCYGADLTGGPPSLPGRDLPNGPPGRPEAAIVPYACKPQPFAIDTCPAAGGGGSELNKCSASFCSGVGARYTPVCANGKTYRNEDCALCNGVKPSYIDEGDCVSVEVVDTCPRARPFNWLPQECEAAKTADAEDAVCGYNLQTYAHKECAECNTVVNYVNGSCPKAVDPCDNTQCVANAVCTKDLIDCDFTDDACGYEVHGLRDWVRTTAGNQKSIRFDGDIKNNVMNTAAAYTLQQTPANWTAALEACAAQGLELATPRSEVENKALALVVGNEWGWLGYSDRTTEGAWTDVNGKQIGQFTKWAPREPNNAGRGGEDCAVTNWNQNGHLWNDMPCQTVLKYVCQAKHKTFTTAQPITGFLVLNSANAEASSIATKILGQKFDPRKEGQTCSVFYRYWVSANASLSVSVANMDGEELQLWSSRGGSAHWRYHRLHLNASMQGGPLRPIFSGVRNFGSVAIDDVKVLCGGEDEQDQGACMCKENFENTGDGALMKCTPITGEGEMSPENVISNANMMCPSTYQGCDVRKACEGTDEITPVCAFGRVYKNRACATCNGEFMAFAYNGMCKAVPADDDVVGKCQGDWDTAYDAMVGTREHFRLRGAKDGCTRGMQNTVCGGNVNYKNYDCALCNSANLKSIKDGYCSWQVDPKDPGTEPPKTNCDYWEACAAGGKTCTCKGEARAWYYVGRSLRKEWKAVPAKDGSIACTSAAFGLTGFNQPKGCECNTNSDLDTYCRGRNGRNPECVGMRDCESEASGEATFLDDFKSDVDGTPFCMKTPKYWAPHILCRPPFFPEWRRIWIRDVFWSQHLGCWGQNTSRIQKKGVYATLYLQVLGYQGRDQQLHHARPVARNLT